MLISRNIKKKIKKFKPAPCTPCPHVLDFYNYPYINQTFAFPGHRFFNPFVDLNQGATTREVLL